MSDVPMMTPHGTFIINGVERVIVPQLARSFGVFFTESESKGKRYFGAKVIPARGVWIEIEAESDGAIYVARKIRSLMYNPIGIVLDSILVITGIGKAVQWIPWAFIVALDIYEVVTGNYEEKDMPTWLRFLLIGCDVLATAINSFESFNRPTVVI